jgi:hypothetical protein
MLLNLATDIQRDGRDNVNKMESLRKIVVNEQGTSLEAILKTEELEKGLIRASEKTDQLPNEVKKTETVYEQHFARLDEAIQTLQTDLKATQTDLKVTQCELTEMKSALQTGQLAYDFEKVLAEYIYPPGTPKVHGKPFAILMKWLEENRDTEKGKEANTKWKNLKKEFGWSPEHRKVFLKMIDCRMKYAHPQQADINLLIPESFTTEEKERAKAIHQMTNRIYQLL